MQSRTTFFGSQRGGILAFPHPGKEARGHSSFLTLTQSGAARLGAGLEQAGLEATWRFFRRGTISCTVSAQENSLGVGGSGQVRHVFGLTGLSQLDLGSFGGIFVDRSEQAFCWQSFFWLKSVRPRSLFDDDDEKGRALASLPAASRFFTEIPLAASLIILNILISFLERLPEKSEPFRTMGQNGMGKFSLVAPDALLGAINKGY